MPHAVRPNACTEGPVVESRSESHHLAWRFLEEGSLMMTICASGLCAGSGVQMRKDDPNIPLNKCRLQGIDQYMDILSTRSVDLVLRITIAPTRVFAAGSRSRGIFPDAYCRVR